MAQAFPQFFLAFCLTGIVLGVPAMMLYAMLRWLEDIFCLVPYFFGMLVYWILLVFAAVVVKDNHIPIGYGLLWSVVSAIPILVIPAMGGWVHRKAGGVSRGWFDATLFMTAFSSAYLGVVVLLFLGVWSLGTRPVSSPIFPVKPMPTEYSTILWIFGCGIVLFAPIITPAMVALVRSLRLHPGVDVPIDEENQLTDSRPRS